MVSVGCRAIAGKRRYALNGAGLGVYVAGGEHALHALAQRSVLAGDWQRRAQVHIDIVVAERIAKKLHFEFSREIVVERESAAVGYLVAFRVKPHLRYQLVYYAASLLCRRMLCAGRRCQLVEHRLGVEVVALLHHAHQYLVDGVEAATDAKSVAGALRLACLAFKNNVVGKQVAHKALYERVFPTDEQRREHGVVVVPAPSGAELVGVFHRLVGVDIAANGVDAHLVDCFDEGAHVVGVEARVEAAYAVDVARKRAVAHFAGIAQLGLELIAAAQTVDGCYRRDEFHRRRWAQKQTRIVTVEHRVGIEVVNHHSDCTCLEHIVLKQIVQVFCHSNIPRQSLLRHLERVGHKRVGYRRTVVFVKLNICLCRCS